jgi:uncharacterized protein (TIGR03083 family)
MRDLIAHTGGGHRWVEAHLRAFAAGRAPEDVLVERPPAGESILTWFRDGARLLVDTLGRLDPEDSIGTSMWNVRLGAYFPSSSLYRHQAKETAVHRWDAQLAAGRTRPFDADLAAEWLDDTLADWLPAAATGGRQAHGPWHGRAVHFRASDVERDWVVRIDGPGAVAVERTAGPADVSVHAGASDLLLLVMNRVGAGTAGIDVTGDATLVELWADTIRYGSSD